MRKETYKAIENHGPCSEGRFLRIVVEVYETWAISEEARQAGADYSDSYEYEVIDACPLELKRTNPCYEPLVCLVGEDARRWERNQAIPF